MSTPSDKTTIPDWLVHYLECSWYDPTSGLWGCLAIDGYHWTPLDVFLIKKTTNMRYNHMIDNKDADTLLGLVIPHNTYCTPNIIDLMKSHGKSISWCKPIDYNDIPDRGGFIIAFDDDLNAYV